MQNIMDKIDFEDFSLAYLPPAQNDDIPLICIHGSWDDHRSWDGLAKGLTDRPLLRYDRRGHSQSSAPEGQGRLSEDVADVIALLDHLDIETAHVVGHSYGANVSIVLASRYPDRVRSLVLLEPPVFGLLTDENEALKREAGGLMKQAAALIEEGHIEEGAKLFIEQVAFGENAWHKVFDAEARATILANAHTWLDQFRDPDRLAVNVSALSGFPGQITLMTGDATLPAYTAVIQQISERLPNAVIRRIGGAGHGMHISHPEAVTDAVKSHLETA
ncbi:alpha/beta fold hydrolase [Celeribacter persicus]|uniref:Pimeloyl-ACP methyl ester carboxylesterase n=1 Tax=Celeribacter persicus TaxID=1651082 RepID=A0A2T5H5K1_9RHOB|nr:alpha/beta hydrolase [Celeribacter persicus]PTQ66840.1 pimeloyl-ACP methyl ester carboxylesterase [Celeribacter persicus]